MFDVIEGNGPGQAGKTNEGPATARNVTATPTAEEATRHPRDWSNVVFAAQYCARKRAEYEERLAG